ncbi:MAG: class I SAM-dependent rRNA methyltransferase, partial [Oscillospiraceae bacterium]|nr:class I SAM-dependent rRNA methyltransferase [Oscillospiraceae bacterium]
MFNYPVITISNKGEKELKNGFPWVYDTEVTTDCDIPDGSVCYAYSEKERYLATGFYNSHSKLRFRTVSTNSNDVVDSSFWKRKVQWAVNYRQTVMGKDFNCSRIIFGDADGFPGLTVDRYEDVLSVEIYCLGIELRKQEIYTALLETFENAGEPITCIRERSEGKLRTLEGMEDSECYPNVPGFDLIPKEKVIIRENGLLFDVDVASGQKTGYFLDQKYNRTAVARLAKGRHVLDCCTHNGGFALNCAAAGAASVLGIDISAPAIRQCEKNAERNKLTNVRFEQQDVFDFLNDTLKAKQHPWDLIILDPPAFTKSRSTVHSASLGYEELNYLAMRLLPRGGYLCTCSCSRFMTPDLFLKTV